MKLITKVRIEGFRSIRNVEIEPFADLTSLAGLNNSGKSNVLRALNAFFNDETDPGQPINVDDDYFRPDLRKKQRKRIVVSVTFRLPPQFNFRKGLEGVRSLLNANSFTITKQWERELQFPTIVLDGKDLSYDDRQKIVQFLQLIKYRYIPNRILPIELIRNEHQSLRNVLVRRLANYTRTDNQTFDAIRRVSDQMIKSLVKRFDEACPGQGTVSLAAPTSWNDLAFTFGYRLARNDIVIEDAGQGSGIQSLLMLETLYLIDRDYFQQFGWRQAAIWGLEEPESSMHASLEARVAAYLAGIAADSKNRLQVVCTTHSDLMVQYSGCTVVANQIDGESRFDAIDDPRDALDRLSRSGVSRWVHPILYWPLDPIILVEGKLDREFLEQAFRFIPPRRQVHVVDLPVLDQSSSGGVASMQKYVKEHASAIRSRRPEAPLVVVLDWDAANKEDQFRSLVDNTAPFCVLVWPENSSNPKAGKCFKGVERFYSRRILDLAIERGAPIARKSNDDYVVTPTEYESVKGALAQIVRDGLESEDLVYSRDFIQLLLLKATEVK